MTDDEAAPYNSFGCVMEVGLGQAGDACEGRWAFDCAAGFECLSYADYCASESCCVQFCDVHGAGLRCPEGTTCRAKLFSGDWAGLLPSGCGFERVGLCLP